MNLRRANQEFTALHEAYVTLLDPRQRAEYDAHLGQPAANLFSPPEGGRRPHRIRPPTPPIETWNQDPWIFARQTSGGAGHRSLVTSLYDLLLYGAVSLAVLLLGIISTWESAPVRNRAAEVWPSLLVVCAPFVLLFTARLRHVQARGGLVRVWKHAFRA